VRRLIMVALTAVAALGATTISATAATDTASEPHPAPASRSSPGVCALGVSLGHWKPQSDAARICRTVYGP
jgi:hypothetical protein